MDEQLVLTAHTLKLNPNMQRSEMSGEVFVVKNVPARRYLTVSIEQWNLLRNFVNPATAPDVLRAVILNRTCLPFREYYELVMKAHRAGILQTQGQKDPEIRATAWHVPIPPFFPLILSWAAVVAALTLLFVEKDALNLTRFLKLPPGDIAFHLGVGYVLLMAGLSLGEALAASVLRGGGGEVYSPRFKYLHPVPHFSVNLDDACMTNRLTQASVWSVRLLFVAGTAAAAWFYYPEFGFLHLFALLLMLHPFDGGTIAQLLSTLCRGNVLDTQKNPLFSLNRPFGVRMKIGLSRVSILYVVSRILWGLGWVLLVLYVGLNFAAIDLKQFLADREYWRSGAAIFISMVIAALVVYFGPPLSQFAWAKLRQRTRRSIASFKRWRVKPSAALTDEQMTRLLAESILFRRLTPADRTELLKVATPRTFKAWQMVVKFADKTPDVGIIISGRALVFRRTKAGRAEKAFQLVEGDVFGAHALLDPERQHAQVKTLSPVVALMIPHAEFERRVVARLGASLSNDLIQKVPFLRQLSFCSNWHPQAIARFAQLASVISFNPDELIVAERQDSQQFYVVYEGRVQVRRAGKVKARLRPGAFFGEVSLLQNSAAVSDVVARDPVRCFTIAKSDFLRFVTHNPLVGLKIERISSKRLGRPIFPLKSHSFDIR